MGKVLGIVYRAIASHLIKKAGLNRKTAKTGAVTLIQRFGRSGVPGALNLNVHFHMLFLDGVYVTNKWGKTAFTTHQSPGSGRINHPYPHSQSPRSPVF